MIQQTFPSKPQDETLTLVFDYLGSLAIGETLQTVALSCSVFSGTESTLTFVGSASRTDTEVSQRVSGGTEGVTYLVTCVVETSAGQSLQSFGYLAIPPLQ